MFLQNSPLCLQTRQMVNYLLLFIPVFNSTFSGENQLNTINTQHFCNSRIGEFPLPCPTALLTAVICVQHSLIDFLCIKSLRKVTLTIFCMLPLISSSNLRFNYLKINTNILVLPDICETLQIQVNILTKSFWPQCYFHLFLFRML